jgi:hypothetical protein
LNNGYSSPSKATKLRENERLVSDIYTFNLNIIGNLVLNGRPCKYNGQLLDLLPNLKNKDYGFCAYVDRSGVFILAAATDANQQNAVIIKQFNEVVPAGLTEGDYFFSLETVNAALRISIYQGTLSDPNPVFKYCLFQESA